ncbi:MAG: hypothetical protein M3114_03475 [Thermoproteota archaeon]|nr:hypothetical protein [Thermoproteota archaeon]
MANHESTVDKGSLKAFYQIFYIISTMSSSSSSSTSIPHISEERNDTGIPVTCSKCNETFPTDSDYVVHYNEMHAEIDPD